jgi:integrase
MNNTFTGAFKAELSLLLSEARAIGLKYIEQERLMHVFDKLSLEYDCTNGLSKELVLAFIEKQPHWKRATHEYRIFMIRKIAIFLNNHGISAYVCDKGRFMKTEEHFKPYIFSYDEINDILKYADSEVQKRCHDRNHLFYPVIFRLLYCCGLRISEALNLKIKNIDFKEGLIQIKNSKNHKDRIIPIPDDLNRRFNEYFQATHKVYHDDDYFFKSPRGGNYKQTTVYHRFRDILFKCGISHGGRDKGGPRLHDLRHTFCVHSLRQFLKNGVAYEAAFPVLSVYMGHSTLSATGKYMRLTADAFPEIADRLESMYGNIIPELEVESHETY